MAAFQLHAKLLDINLFLLFTLLTYIWLKHFQDRTLAVSDSSLCLLKSWKMGISILLVFHKQLDYVLQSRKRVSSSFFI